MTSFSYTGAALSNLVGNTPGANVSNLVTLLNDLKTFLNAPNLDGANIADIPESLLAIALQQKLGLNDGGQIGRGKSIIATTGTRTNTAYGALSDGPDQVASVVLPTDGLIRVAYQATWQESVTSAAKAAIFIGANQLKINASGGAAPVVQEVGIGVASPTDNPLSTYRVGLVSGGSSVAIGANVTTGQVVGGPGLEGGECLIFAAAGTYTVSVQFKAAAGTVTAKDRRLWVWTIGF